MQRQRHLLLGAGALFRFMALPCASSFLTISTSRINTYPSSTRLIPLGYVLDANGKMKGEKAPRKGKKDEDFFEYRGDSCKLRKHSRSRPIPPFAFDRDVDNERSGSWEKRESMPLIIAEDFSKLDSLDASIATDEQRILVTSRTGCQAKRTHDYAEDIFISIHQSSNRRTGFLESRAYAKSYQFASVNATRRPTSQDLAPPEPFSIKSPTHFWSWMGLPFRAAVALLSYVVFPFITERISNSIGDSTDDLGRIAVIFTPGISIVYGTFISLTLSILYNRQSRLQENVSVESAVLSLLGRDLLLLFRGRKQGAIDACQCVADQVRTLVRGSRGSELMGLIYCDPYGELERSGQEPPRLHFSLCYAFYDLNSDFFVKRSAIARIIEIVADFECELSTSNDAEEQARTLALIASIRDACKDIIKVRALRLSDESLTLPSTHFFVLTALTTLMLLGFIITTITSSGGNGHTPSNESAILFSFLCSVYVLLYKDAEDLNRPFEGIYQIRRSSIACSLLQIKWLLCNHPLTKGEVDFDHVDETLKVVNGGMDLSSLPLEEACFTGSTPGLGCRVCEMQDFQ